MENGLQKATRSDKVRRSEPFLIQQTQSSCLGDRLCAVVHLDFAVDIPGMHLYGVQ